MFQIGKALVSDEILDNDFLCNLKSCKGACCIEGDAGAPLTHEETLILEEIYPKIKHLLRKEGITAIEQQGVFVLGNDGEFETTLVNGKECAYVVFDGDISFCGIEKAHNEGLVDWKKPVSCHLYPIRIKSYTDFDAINYDRWDICDAACELGKTQQLPIYKFVKEALIRKYGIAWYQELEQVAEQLKKEDK